ncbi:MAG: BMA_0021/BMA_0022 family TOMM bacteriocin [Myxococcota bacterium]|nr:BMA_0021/BMA_0022 family TOMM bacteriocin [Myxococcota bacterium]
MSTLDGDLMSFRTAWLRAVALAWSKDGFRTELLRDPIAALKTHLSFNWPWQGVLEFTVFEQPQFKWIGDDWVWPADGEDELTLRLPLTPLAAGAQQTRLGIDDHVLALADYYAARPSIFGTTGGGGSTPRGGSLVTSAAIDLAPTASLSIGDYMLAPSSIQVGGHGPPPGGFVPSGGSFTDFEVVLISAMARAWENHAFAELLNTNFPLALQTIRGYSEPWRLILKIENDGSARWNKTHAPSRWEGLSAHRLRLNLPSKPNAVSDRSVALAAYNATGAEFPFTCCA